jgi:putative aldouronate transport system substrate-binding protein
MPTTTEEFKNTLIAFRDRIPPINGQKIIPFSASPYNFSQSPMKIGTLAGWFGVNASDIFAMIDGKLEITVDKPEYREFLKYFADLHANGLIDPELFSQDETTWKSKGKLGLYGVSYAYAPGDFSPNLIEDTTVNRWAFEALPVLRAPGVEKPVYNRGSYGFTIFRTQAVITDNAKNPLTIIRWFDYLYDPVASFESYWGHIGIRFEQLADGTFRETQNGRDPEVMDSVEPTFFWAMPRFIRPGTEVLPPEGQLPNYDGDKIRDNLYEPYLDEMIPQAWPDRRASQQIQQLTQAIRYYHDQKVAAWISGQADIDAEWDSYLANLKQLGIDELLSLRRGLIGE